MWYIEATGKVAQLRNKSNQDSISLFPQCVKSLVLMIRYIYMHNTIENFRIAKIKINSILIFQINNYINIYSYIFNFTCNFCF